MERTIAGERIGDELEGILELLQVYRKSWNGNVLRDYEEACSQLEEMLDLYGQYTADSQDTRDYIRRLRGFIE